MVVLGFIASTVIMGLLLAGSAVALSHTGNRRATTVEGAGALRRADQTPDSLTRYASMVDTVARTPMTWYIAVLVLGLGFAAGGIAFVVTPPAVSAMVGLWMAVAFAGLLCVFLFWGVYHSSRYRGLVSAQAAITSVLVLGGVVLVAVVLKLLLTG